MFIRNTNCYVNSQLISFKNIKHINITNHTFTIFVNAEGRKLLV